MQIIPALDLLGDYAVRLEQGDYDRVLFRQPIEEFMGRIVATRPELIHIVDLEGARDGDELLDVVAVDADAILDVLGRGQQHLAPVLRLHVVAGAEALMPSCVL